MSTASQTKIFGIRVGINPKLIVVVLLAIAGLLFWYNSRSGEGEAGNTASPAPAAADTSVAETTAAPVRRGVASRTRGTLAFRKVDPAGGNIDPTLRLDLLARLQRIELGSTGRNIFETGPSPAALQAARNLRGPVVPPRPIAATRPVMTAPARPMVSIPLKYYGFVKPANKTKPNRGFFLEGDNVLVASEGEMVLKRYLVVELTPNLAKMEDVQLKQGQTLPVVPEAVMPQ